MNFISDLSVTAWKRPVSNTDLPPTGATTPQLLLDFSNSFYEVAGESVGLPVTFTRASDGTYFDATGVMKTAAADEPRFDHDPVTGEALGLLMEESRTNFLEDSENFGAWLVSNATIEADSVISPEGILSGAKAVENSSTNKHLIRKVVSIEAGKRYTGSIFAKSANRGLFLQVWTAGGTVEILVDLQAGTVLFEGPKVEMSTVINVGDGWYHLSMTFDQDIDTNAQFALYLNDYVASNNRYNGDGTSFVELWGAQLEVGGRASSYIPTTNNPVTRAGDNAVMQDVSWLTQGQGTLVVEGGWNNLQDPNFNSYAVALRDTTTEVIGIRSASVTSGVAQSVSVTGGTNTAPLLAGGTGHEGMIRKMAFAYAPDNFAFTVNGEAPDTDNSGAVPTSISELRVGQLSDGAGHIDGHVKKVTYYDTRLTNEKIQEITT